jgi:hypothetical protein
VRNWRAWPTHARTDYAQFAWNIEIESYGNGGNGAAVLRTSGKTFMCILALRSSFPLLPIGFPPSLDIQHRNRASEGSSMIPGDSLGAQDTPEDEGRPRGGSSGTPRDRDIAS